MTKAPNTKRRHVTMRGVLHACLALGLVATMFTAAGTSPGYAQHVHDGTTQTLQIGGGNAKVLDLGSNSPPDSAYPQGWTQAGFNDSTSQWNPAVPVAPTVQNCAASSVSGWGASKGYYGPSQAEYYIFRQDFQLPSANDFYGSVLSVGGTSSVLGDVYVNGHQVTPDYHPPSNNFQQVAIGQYLLSGPTVNVIAFTLARNAYDSSSHNPCNAVTFTASIIVHTVSNSAPAPTPLSGSNPTLTIGGAYAKVIDLGSTGPSDDAYPNGWTSAGFDDSAWPSVAQAPVSAQSCASSIQGWGTSTGYYGPSQAEHYIFRQDFQLPTTANDFYGSVLSVGGTSSVLGDVYVNGHQVTPDYHPPSNNFQQVAIGQYLLSGPNVNVIAFALAPNAVDHAGNPCNAVTFTASIIAHTESGNPPEPTPQPFGTSTLPIGGAYAKVIDLGSTNPSGDASPNGWTSAGFDDSAWPSVAQAPTSAQSCASSIQGWGTSTGYYGPSQIEHYIFRQDFQLPFAINYLGSLLSIGGTSSVLGDVYVNGHQVTPDYHPPSNNFQQVAIGQYFLKGANVIAFALNPYAVDAANNPCNAVTFTANITMNTSPTATPTSPPTNTPTDTPYPSPTNTPTATPTNTPYPLPTATPTTAPSSTPIPTTPPTIPTTPPGAPTPSPTPTGEQNKAFGSPTPTLSPPPPTPTRTAIVFLPASRCGKPVVTRILVNGRSLRQRPDVTHGVAASVTIHVSDRTRVSVSVALTHQVRTVGRHGRIGHKTVVLEQASGNVTPGRRGYATANLRLARLHKGIGAVSLVIGAHPLCGTSS